MTAASIERDLRDNQGRIIRAQVFAAHDLARQHGCSMVGFGGYTSIATMNCAEFVEDGPAVTTGNALTVGLGMEAVHRVAAEMGFELGTARAAICGATGNIGQVYASLLGSTCGEVTLIGRAGAKRRLKGVARELARELVRDYQQGQQGGALFRRFVEAYRAAGEPAIDDLQMLDQVEKVLGAPLVKLSEDLADLRDADVIVASSNSATPIIHAEHLASDRPVLICDVSVPPDVGKDVENCANVRVIQGGIAAVTNDPDFALPGFPLPPGHTYACAAETLVLGLAGVARDFSRGAITPAQVREIVALAQLHGFRLGSSKTERTKGPASSARNGSKPAAPKDVPGTTKRHLIST
jgi:predicted amino acid dehydrogenase